MINNNNSTLPSDQNDNETIHLPNSFSKEWQTIVEQLSKIVAASSNSITEESSDQPTIGPSFKSIGEWIEYLKQLDETIIQQNNNDDDDNKFEEELSKTTNYHFKNLSFLYKKMDGKKLIMTETEFMKKVIPKICEWVLDLENQFPSGQIPVLTMNQPGVVKLTKRQIRSIMSCAFCCLFRERGYESKKKMNVFQFGLFLSVASLNFLMALFHYFERMYELDIDKSIESSSTSNSSLDEVIIFERQVLKGDYKQVIEEQVCKSQLSMCPMIFKQGKIQDSLNCLMVDFANCMIGGHVLGGAVAQEEILFAECPELFVSILICPQMQVHETIKFTGFERYSNLKGYTKGMTYERYQDNQPVIDNVRSNQLVAMDALQGAGNSQFQKEYILREIFKSTCGFSSKGSSDFLLDSHKDQITATRLENEPIASGFYGCGVFGGSKHLKVIIQWLSATLCNRPSLYIHLFSPEDEQFEQEFNLKLLPLIVEKNITLGQLASALLNIYPTERRNSGNLFDFLNLYFGDNTK